MGRVSAGPGCGGWVGLGALASGWGSLGDSDFYMYMLSFEALPGLPPDPRHAAGEARAASGGGRAGPSKGYEVSKSLWSELHRGFRGR